MPILADILEEKGSQIQTVGPDATVLEAATLMNEHKIGSLLVTEGGRMVGIVTERDVLRRVVAERRDPADTRINEIMTTEVACAAPDMSTEEARSVMKERRIRHLPVIDGDDMLLGLVSIGDLNAYRLEGQEVTIHYLREYLHGTM